MTLSNEAIDTGTAATIGALVLDQPTAAAVVAVCTLLVTLLRVYEHQRARRKDRQP
jgi:hypothetical protein